MENFDLSSAGSVVQRANLSICGTFQTSDCIAPEVEEAFYTNATCQFRFRDGRVAPFGLDRHSIRNLKNIELIVDANLSVYFPRNPRNTEYQRYQLRKCVDLFGGLDSPRKAISIIFEGSFWSCGSILTTKLLDRLTTLVGFRTVTIKLKCEKLACGGWEYHHIVPRAVLCKESECGETKRAKLRAPLETSLGPCDEYDKEEYHCFVFHPRNHLARSRS